MICQHIAVEDLLQLFALFAVSNIPLVRFQQFYGIFLTEIRCLQCLQITGIHLKHIFVSLFAGNMLVLNVAKSKLMLFFKSPKRPPKLTLTINGDIIEQV